MSAMGITGIDWIDEDQAKAEVNSPLVLGAWREARCGILNPARHVRELKGEDLGVVCKTRPPHGRSFEVTRSYCERNLPRRLPRFEERAFLSRRSCSTRAIMPYGNVVGRVAITNSDRPVGCSTAS